MRLSIHQAVVAVSVGALFLGVSRLPAVETVGNPYTDIVTRNAFGLKPPPPPPVVEPPKEETAPSNIVMTGITTISGKKQVYLKITTPGKTEPDYLKLGENERQGAIEVTEISPKTGRVRIKNRGVASVISFDTHGNVANVAAPVAPGGVRPGMPGAPGVPPVPGSAPAAGVPAPTSVSSALPVSPNNTAIRSTGDMMGTTSQPNMTRSIPTRPLRVSPGGSSSPNGASYNSNYQAPPAPKVDPVAQKVQMEINRQIQPPDFPPLPQ